MDSRRLSGPEIRALLTDARVEGKHELEGYHFVREYREKTFEQKTDGRRGDWSVSGSRVCIRWEGSGRSYLCRYIVTNDRGDYWKVLQKRKGGDKRVVTYSAITDLQTGSDRRVMGSPLIIVMRIVFSPMGWGVMIGAFLIYGWWRGSQPTPITVGGKSYTPKDLEELPLDELEGLFVKLVDTQQHRDARRMFEIMRLSAGSHSGAWTRIWKHVAALPDATAITLLSQLLQAENPAIFPSSLLDSVKEDPRAVYLIGRGYTLWAESVRRTHDATGFAKARGGGMVFLDHLRENSGAPVPDPAKEAAEPSGETVGSPVEGASAEEKSAEDDPNTIDVTSVGTEVAVTKDDGTLDYVAMAAGAYETVMYLQHDPPAYVASGSSGGGG